MNNKTLGQNGEDIACKFLEKQGYKILERNKRYSRFCELDIIAQYKDITVFVEVKTRKTNDFGTPFEAITKSKFENIYKGTQYYINENRIKNYRIDVIGITIKPEIKIEHLKNISLF